MRATIRQAAETGGLVLVPAAVAWLSGLPFVFPSLGPSASVLATRPDDPACRPRRVVGGHVVGVLTGLVAGRRAGLLTQSVTPTET